MSSYKVYSQPLGDFATNAYLLVHEKNAIAIDAPPGSGAFYQKICDEHGFNLKNLLLTHSHFDHIADAFLIQAKGIKVGVHKLDELNCKKPGSDGLPLMIKVGPFVPDFFLEEGPCLIDGFPLRVIHTPGHTPGGVCIICSEHLFSGDTLFKGAIGNLSFPTAEPLKMKNSLEKLYQEHQNFIVYPGHGPKTRLDSERLFIKQMIEYKE